MAKAKYFTQNNEKVYPISHTKAVYDGNGKVLEDRLTEDETAISSLQTDVKGKADKTDVDNKLNSNSTISDTTVAFTEASVRENIVSNEKSSTLFGKVQKWFSDLKKVAFTGSYNDLIDTPSNATTTINGLMSSSDKIKLNGISSNANNYIHPTTSGNKHIPSGGSSGQILKWSADGTAIWGTEKTYSNATSSSPGLMSATDKIDLDACVETLNADASMFLSFIKSPASTEFEFDETLSLSNLTLTGNVIFSDINLFNNYASLTEITSDLYDIIQKNVDNGLDFIGNMMHYNPGSGIRFDFTSSDPVYLNTGSNKTGKWYYDGNELATKSDIPSTSDFLKTSGGTMTGTYTLTSGYSINSSYNSNLKLIRVNSNTNYFGEQAAANTMTNYFGYRNNNGATSLTNYFGAATSASYRTNLNNYIGRYSSHNYIGDDSNYNYVGRQTDSNIVINYFGYRSGTVTTTMTNHFGCSYSSSYKSGLGNNFGSYAATNSFGSYATSNFFGEKADISYYYGNSIYLGDSTSHPVYMQGSTSYKVVGTTTGYNTKIHVASSQPSNMSVGDIWFKIPS